MTPTELIALGTAVASGLYTLWQSAMSGIEQERQDERQAEQARLLAELQARLGRQQQEAQAELTDKGAEAQARREYRFEALKRLYRDVQPLMFQMRDPMQSAVDHVANFARAAREGKLTGADRPWLKDAYYLDATLYRLTAPAACYELLRERLSLIDLSLEARAAATFRLLDQYTRAMRADYRLGRGIYGEAGYQPDAERAPPDGSNRRQGMLAGTRDVMVQSMLHDGPDGPDGGPRRRVARFGEFQNSRLTSKDFDPFVAILAGLRVEEAPVLCALLLVLAGLAELTRRTLAKDEPSMMSDAAALVADDSFWSAYDFGLAPDRMMKLRRVAMSDLLECAARAADQAA